jgi:hypothetical protein
MSAIDACGRCDADLEEDDLRCPVCAFLVSGVTSSHDPHAAAVKVFRCGGCGAACSWSAEKAALACGFCGGATHLETLKDPLEQTEAWLPFRVDAAAANEALRTWQKSLSWFRPGDLASSSKVQSLKPMYWPAWLVDAHADVTWAADSDAGSGQSAWAPHSGDVDLAFDGLLVGASRGLSQPEMEGLTPAYDVRSQAASPTSVASLIDESFDVQRSMARERVAAACTRAATATVRGADGVGGHIPGKKFRNVKVALVLSSLTTTRLSLPAWVMAYRYGSDVYRVVIHGQDRAVVMGKAPWSVWKILAAVAGGVVAIALIVLVIVLLTHSRHR